ncbi:DUF4229 domain-containing protein [Corynebacterium aquatimens]
MSGARVGGVEERMNETDKAPQVDPAARRRANKAAAVYGGLRLLLFVVLTVVIQGAAMLIGAQFPLIMSALLALIVAFPLSMLVFSKQRVEAVEAMATWNEQRRARKEWVREELAGRG